MSEAIYSLPKPKGFLGAASRDGMEVYPDRVVIDQRAAGKGDISIPKDQITEVRADGQWSLDGKGHRLHLRVGSKKYVVRHLKREEAEGLAEAISSIL